MCIVPMCCLSGTSNKEHTFKVMRGGLSGELSRYPIAAFENKNHMTVSYDGPSVKFEGWRKRG